MSRMMLHEILNLCDGRPAKNGWNPSESATRAGNLVEVLRAGGRFRLFEIALRETELEARLREAGPYTVFAPTDRAFQRFPNLAELLCDAQALREVVSRHIVWGYFDTQALKAIPLVAPIRGAALRLDGVRVDGTRIAAPDLKAANGIVHGLDRVLTPQSVPAWEITRDRVSAAVRNGALAMTQRLRVGVERLEGALQGHR
ncbi:MAG: fasciclin domain-containing protein [Planctomycetes bacterium]|nr:fasciclin domain-containing protein [Planctomycetota bacterium]